jgi:hypothetical protein
MKPSLVPEHADDSIRYSPLEQLCVCAWLDSFGFYSIIERWFSYSDGCLQFVEQISIVVIISWLLIYLLGTNDVFLVVNETLLLIFITLGIRGFYSAHSEMILSISICLDDLITGFLLFSFPSKHGGSWSMSSYVCLVSLFLLFFGFPRPSFINALSSDFSVPFPLIGFTGSH